jgi:hypothetical protein
MQLFHILTFQRPFRFWYRGSLKSIPEESMNRRSIFRAGFAALAIAALFGPQSCGGGRKEAA